MSMTEKSGSPSSRYSLTLDAWAVIVALALALLVRLDILKNVQW
jgi:hypothetical protein